MVMADTASHYFIHGSLLKSTLRFCITLVTVNLQADILNSIKTMPSHYETPIKVTWSRIPFQKMISWHWIKSRFLLTDFSTDFHVRYLLEPGTYYDIFPENLELSYYSRDGKCSSRHNQLVSKEIQNYILFRNFLYEYSDVFLLFFLLLFFFLLLLFLLLICI